MKTLFWPAAIAIALTACNNSKEKETPAGGPCTYTENAYPARLLKLLPVDSTGYDAQFELPAGYHTPDKPDTISYHSVNNQYISAAAVLKDSIREGIVYKYIEQTIRSGSCNPHIMTVRLEKFE